MTKAKNTDSVCFYSTSWRGGDGWYTHALAEGLAQALMTRKQALIFLASPMQPKERDASHANLTRLHFRSGQQQSVGKLLKLTKTALRIADATLGMLKARRHSSTFVVTFPHWLSITFLQFLMLKCMGTRLIYIVHDPLPHAWNLPPMLHWLERWLLLTTYRLSDDLVTLTHAGRHVMINQLGMKSTKLSVIPHGVFDSGQATLPKGNRRFLIFGMLRSNKCILESLRAFAQIRSEFPDAHLVVAGAPYGAEPDYWRSCEVEIAALGDAITTEIGFVEESRLNSLFTECDAVLLPYANFNSQSGVAVLAALSMRPVLGTAVGGIAELFDMGMCGIPIDAPPTVEKIAIAMRTYCETPASDWRDRVDLARIELLKKLAWPSIGESFTTLIAGRLH